MFAIINKQESESELKPFIFSRVRSSVYQLPSPGILCNLIDIYVPKIEYRNRKKSKKHINNKGIEMPQS